MRKVLEKEISQDEAYQRSGHPILEVDPLTRRLLDGIYEYQLRESKPLITSKEIKRDA